MPLPSLPPLYPIVDEGAANLAGHTVSALAQAFVEGGARLLQIRAKLAPSGRFVEQALAVAALAHPAGALVVINDRVDVALAAGIRAVHVGQDDVPAAMVRRFLGPEGIIGLSTHTRAQIDAALYEPIDYLAVGPIFETTSKDPGYDAVTWHSMIAYAASKTELPIVAIGGITGAGAPRAGRRRALGRRHRRPAAHRRSGGPGAGVPAGAAGPLTTPIRSGARGELALQDAVAAAVAEVDHEADHQPDDRAQPGVARQRHHQAEAAEDAHDRDEGHQRRP